VNFPGSTARPMTMPKLVSKSGCLWCNKSFTRCRGGSRRAAASRGPSARSSHRRASAAHERSGSGVLLCGRGSRRSDRKLHPLERTDRTRYIPRSGLAHGVPDANATRFPAKQAALHRGVHSPRQNCRWAARSSYRSLQIVGSARKASASVANSGPARSAASFESLVTC
jgi:hypothetical protein